jgi:hypothetical protein
VSLDPQKAKYCRERAAECEALAEGSGRATTRELMLYLAARWNGFADEYDGKTPSGPIDGLALPPSG